ncbi:MAG: flagellar biosynthesis protein FlhA [Acidobacteriota bacterium]|nr:flagellar biosynthesis protein FlhA [Acidobacteriota bacterium]
MPEAKPKSLLKAGSLDWIVPAAAVSVVFVMMVPMPAFLLDLLLAMSITASVIVLLSAVYLLRPVQFSVFPSLLLLLTLYRLALNLASSRRILLHGNEGTSAAGQVIAAFGQFVVGGNYVVGFVIFIALIAIQFLVVSHGAVRTAEVTARFTLDAMPGKQMAIDADLNAGLIDEKQARARREAVTHEAEFYGAMDGAARFSQRDALATILLTAINIVAGFLIGVFQLDIPFRDALKTYTVLTVGDGLVTMIPSLLISIAGGLVVTRASSGASLSGDLGQQLFAKPRVLWIAAAALFAMGIIPGMPKFSFFLMVGLLSFMAWRLQKVAAVEAAAAAAKPGAATAPPPTGPEALDALIALDDISLEVGYALIPLVDTRQGGQLLPRVRALRKHLAGQLGFVIPSVHITDNLRLKPREYVIYLRGVEIARWEMPENMVLAISSDPLPPKLPGTVTKEPAFGVPARWITSELREQALALGYSVVDQTSVMATHISELIRQYAHELLTRSETKRLLDRLSDSHPKLLEELIPKLMSLGEIQRVLQQLLREQVSIRDLGTVLETLVETAPVSKNTVVLVEACRQALGRWLIKPLLDDQGTLKVVTLDPRMEEELTQAITPQMPLGGAAALQPTFIRRLLEALRKMVGEHAEIATPVILCSANTRFHLRRLLEPFLPKVVVISHGEIPALTPVHSIGSLNA